MVPFLGKGFTVRRAATLSRRALRALSLGMNFTVRRAGGQELTQYFRFSFRESTLRLGRLGSLG